MCLYNENQTVPTITCSLSTTQLLLPVVRSLLDLTWPTKHTHSHTHVRKHRITGEPFSLQPASQHQQLPLTVWCFERVLKILNATWAPTTVKTGCQIRWSFFFLFRRALTDWRTDWQPVGQSVTQSVNQPVSQLQPLVVTFRIVRGKKSESGSCWSPLTHPALHFRSHCIVMRAVWVLFWWTIFSRDCCFCAIGQIGWVLTVLRMDCLLELPSGEQSAVLALPLRWVQWNISLLDWSR